MRMVSFARSAVLIVALFGFVPCAHAAPITYVQTGTASGTLGATPFNDAFVTMTLTGDTNNVVPELFGAFNCPFCYVNEGTVTIDIPGVGTATVTDPSGVWVFGQPVDIDDDPTTPELPAVVIGTVDDPPATDSFTGIGGTGSMALLGYDLTTPIGPVSSVLLGGVGYPPALFLNTDLGVLRFRENLTSDPDGTFTATVGVAEVPEPATLFLFGSGVAAFAARARRRGRR
jgi:PEP-CTERM motif